ncbi:MAG: hypothetical protein HXM91_09715, partial [Oribacterium sinus]|nr:hypothetical protein [Oribacterium sinus]
GQVVPTCLWEFLSRHTNIDAVKKRQQKGFLFTIGDMAEIRSDSVGATISRVIGDDIGTSVTKEDLLNEVKQSFHVFHIMIGGDSQENEQLLPGHCIVLARQDISCLPEIIISAIQLQKGAALEEVLGRWDEINRPVISAALAQLSLQRDEDIFL